MTTLRSALLLALALLSACANPVPPTGGPEDRTPPALVTSDPETGAVDVDVDTRTVTIEFSEYVDPAAFGRSLSVTPPFETPPEVAFGGRRARITFPERLRDNTTYLLTLDTDLRDLRGVTLARPLTIAFSTGPTIAAGTIAGRVVEPDRGAPAAGLDVYAYAAPDSTPPAALPDRPDYRTQTGTDGAFRFDYLTEAPYYVVALADRNRNRRADPGEAFAAPPVPIVHADSVGEALPAPWIAAAIDTTAPAVQRVRVLSRARLAVRFSEPVALADRDAAAWSVTDSVSGAPRDVRAVYARADAPLEVFLSTEPLAPGVHRLAPGAVRDTSGNAASGARVSFTVPPDAPADTLRPRFVRFDVPARPFDDEGADRLLPDEAPVLVFAAPPPDSLLRAAVAAADTAGAPRPFTLATDDGTAYRAVVEPPLGPDERVRIAVRSAPFGGPDTTSTRTFAGFSIRDLGGRTGVVAAPDATGAAVVVELYPPEDAARTHPYTTIAGPDGRYAFTALPAGAYRLRAFVDRDGDGAWDPGRLAPYAPAEPLAWGADSLAVQPRWDRAAADTLRFAPGGLLRMEEDEERMEDG